MKLLKILAGLIVILLIALGIFISTFDVNKYKGEIITLVEEKTGREFDITGDLKLGVSLIPTVKVEQVKLGNADWGSQPDMVRVSTFEVELGLIPLFSGQVKINQLVLDSAEILLETNKEGKGNWEFQTKKETGKAAPKQDKDAGAVPAINISELNIKNSKLTYKDGVTGKVTSIFINEFVAEGGAFSQALDVLLKAEYNKVPITLDGSLGSLESLTNNRNFPMDFEAGVGEAKLKAQGEIAEPLNAKGLNLDLEFNTTTFEPFEKITGQKLPKLGPVEANGHISEKDDIYKLDAVNVNAINSSIVLDGQVSAKTPAKGFAFTFDMNTDNLSNFNAIKDITGREFSKTPPVNIKGNVSEKDGIYNLKAINASMGKTQLKVDGTLTDLKKTEGSNLNIDFASESLSELNVLAGSDLPAIGPISLKANITDQKGAYLLKNMQFKAAQTDLAGDMLVNIKDKRTALTANLSSNVIDLVPFTGKEEKQGKEEKKVTKKEKVFPSEPLPFESLKAVDANLDIKAKQIKTADLTMSDTVLSMKLNNGNLQIAKLNSNFGGGTLAMNMTLDASSGKSGTLETNLAVKNFQPSTLPDYKDKFTGAKTDLDTSVKGSGNSIAAIMAGLNGKFIMQMGPGTFKSSSAGAATADAFTSLKNAIYKDGGSSGVTEIVCGVVNLNIKDGIATADKGIAINTSKMNIIGSGIIDLKTEKLDIGIDPQAREGVGISAGQLAELVRIGGTLAEPKAVPDTKAAVMAGVSAGAAVATGGLSIIAQGLFDKETADEDPCKTALGIKQAKAKPAETAPKEEPKSVTEKATDTVKDVGKSITEGIKGLFD
jgi:AsmA family protein